MSSSHPLHPSLRQYLPAVLALLGLAACESDRRPPPAPTSAAAEVATPEMEAQGIFFDGQIQVETLLNRGGFAGRAGGAGGTESSPAGPTGGAGRRGGGGGRGGGRGRGAGGGAALAESSGGGGDNAAAPHIHPSNLPSLRLHLRLTNLGSTPVEVEVTDFNSDLGNFAVQPEKIPLPPHAPVEAEPMISRLGVASDAIPLTVSLRAGDQTEKQVLVLRPVKPPPPPPTTSAPSLPAS